MADVFGPVFMGPSGGRPPTADDIASVRDNYQSLEQSEAQKIADGNVSGADKDLQRWNRNSGRIKSENMGKDCKACDAKHKEMTIKGLKTTHEDQEHSTEYEGEAKLVLGVKQSVKTAVGGDTKSGTYYYVDQNNNWIKVTAKDAMVGKKEKAELSGGAGVDIKGVSIGATVAGSGSAPIPGDNVGLPR